MTVKPIYTAAEARKLHKIDREAVRLGLAGGDTRHLLRAMNEIRDVGLKRGEEQAALEEEVRKEAARELAAAKASRKTLAQQKRAAAIRAVDAAKVQRHADRKASKVKSSSWLW